MDIPALKAELTTDPLTRGYAGMSDEAAAADLNTVYRTKTRDTVPGSEIFNATDDGEFGALTDVQKSQWINLCGVDAIDTSSGVAKSLEAALFGGGTATRVNLAAVRSPAASRAVELGLGTVVASHVEQARAYHV